LTTIRSLISGYRCHHCKSRILRNKIDTVAAAAAGIPVGIREQARTTARTDVADGWLQERNVAGAGVEELLMSAAGIVVVAAAAAVAAEDNVAGVSDTKATSRAWTSPTDVATLQTSVPRSRNRPIVGPGPGRVPAAPATGRCADVHSPETPLLRRGCRHALMLPAAADCAMVPLPRATSLRPAWPVRFPPAAPGRPVTATGRTLSSWCLGRCFRLTVSLCRERSWPELQYCRNTTMFNDLRHALVCAIRHELHVV
jgi:hypothetical protein